MPNDDDLSDMLNRDEAATPKPPAPAPGDRSAEDETADSSSAFHYDPSSAMQSFLRRQRDKILELLQHSPSDIGRIHDLYLAHIVGQFHIVGPREWNRFWSLIDGLFTLDASLRKGSILLGGWKEEGVRLTPPSSLSDNVTAFSKLKELHEPFVMLEIYAKAVRLQRLYQNAHYQRDRDSLKGQFEDWVIQHHVFFRPLAFDDSHKKLACPPMTMDEINEFARSGRFDDLQGKAEKIILRLSNLKAVHFLPGDSPQKAWKDFHWFCSVYNLFAKPDPDNPNLYRLNPCKLKYYFLIQP